MNLNNAAINLNANTAIAYHIITLGAGVDRVLLYGTASRNISFISSRTGSLSIYLSGANFTAVQGQNAITKNTGELHLIAVGTLNSTVRGADGASRVNRPQETGTLSHGTPSNARPPARASNGRSGLGGEIGGDGTSAIRGSNITVSGTRALNLFGGDGGRGGAGGRAQNGAFGNNGIQGGGRDNGVPGGHGGRGGDGGRGGNGGIAVQANILTNNNVNLTIRGGAAGRGGNGGHGGNGGQGGRGAAGRTGTNGNRRGAGGGGGNGGNGGNGAAAGIGGIAFSGNPAIGERGAINVSGNAGNGGIGGAGGLRGQSGWNGWAWEPANNNGVAGTNGARGFINI